MKKLFSLLLLAGICAGTEAQITVLEKEALHVINPENKIEKIAEGFEWSEGPLYIEQGDFLLFSDVPRNKIYKWKEGEGLSLYLDSSGFVGSNPPKRESGSNGLLLDNDGNLVICQHGLRQVARMDAPLNNPAAKYIPLAKAYQNKKLNSPNDAVFHSNGYLFFTDPPYAHEKLGDDPAVEQDIQGIFRAKPGGRVDLVNGDIDFPNGIALTPDEKYLIVGYSNSENMVWMKYELNADGLVKSSSVFYKLTEEDKRLPGAPDGLKINRKGYVFASGPGGIWIFNPGGKPIARIYTGQATSNCAFDPDERTLFMTCDNFVYRLRLK